LTTRPELTDTSLELLERLDPAARTRLTAAGVEDALDDLACEISQHRRQGRKHSDGARLRFAIILATIVAAGAGVATAAVVIGTHTGLFPSKTEVPVGGPGEELNPAAPDFRQVALELASDVPYPAAYSSWREWVLTEQAPTSRSGPGGSTFPAGLVTTGALRGWFAASAFCAWVQDWRQAKVAGDAGEADRAAQTIAGAPQWKAVTAEDPNPSPAASNDPGAKTGTLFGWLLPYRSAVLAGDSMRVEQLLANGYGDGRCWLADPQWIAQLRLHPEWARLSPGELAQRYKQFLEQGRS
jgi:hypothetical protein